MLSIHHLMNCITITYLIGIHMSDSRLFWDMFWPVLPSLTSAAAETPTLTNSIIALKNTKFHFPG